ncbi:MAG TPA: RNA polymerase sigma factor [Cyclobacteriaceae bacterium]|nr:RNA polymerase sigma factor [Cyclobacteriaceae bacterium]
MNTPQTVFEQLHTAYQPMVMQMCTGFVKGDRDIAADLSQEVFINVWNALPGFRSESSHKTWIYRITVNTCLQYIRKSKNKTRLPLEHAGTVTETPNTEEERASSLMRSIGQLENVDRLIIMMVLDELEYEEIARVMGISENNLRVKIHRIKLRLKTLMKDGE